MSRSKRNISMFPTIPLRPNEPDNQTRNQKRNQKRKHCTKIFRELNARKDTSPILEGCKCYTCQNHTKAYINHLFNVHEMLAQIQQGGYEETQQRMMEALDEYRRTTAQQQLFLDQLLRQDTQNDD